MTNAMLSSLAIGGPLLCGLVVLFLDRRPNIRDGVVVVGSLSTAAVPAYLLLTGAAGTFLAFQWYEMLPGLSLAFHVDAIGLLFSVLALFLWAVTVLYSVGYMRGHHEANQTRFYALFAVSIAAANGIAFSANLFTLYVFYEILTFSTYPLVTHAGHDKAKRGGRTYLNLLLATSILFFLPAMIATFLSAGSLEFVPGGMLGQGGSQWALGMLLVLFIFGIGKAAMIPFHGWLPAAMVAPTPVSALLHAVAVVKAGVFAIIKVCGFIFGADLITTLPITQWLIYAAGLSVLFASVMALRQTNLKLRLAYSTVSQLGYITAGALVANASSFTGSIMHLVMHGFGKITLFFCAGAILVASGKSDIRDMHGLGWRMPVTMSAFFIASLMIIGVPPAGGLWSKWYLLQGAIEADQWFLLAVLGISSLLSIAYLMPVAIRAFFPGGSGSVDSVEIREAPLPCVIALSLTAAFCILLFFYPDTLYNLASSVAEQL